MVPLGATRTGASRSKSNCFSSLRVVDIARWKGDMTRRNSEIGSENLIVEVSDTQSHMTVDQPMLRALVMDTLQNHHIDIATISIVVVDNADIHILNGRYLGHDWPTDVITFPISDAGDQRFIGELVVSGEMAATTAREIGVDPGDELALYVVHGLLHLCGYDDITAKGRAAMRAAESVVLSAAGITNPFELIERARRETSSCMG